MVDPALIFFIIALVIVVVLVVTFFILGYFEPPPATLSGKYTPSEYENMYKVPSIWGWDDHNTSVPVDGPKGECKLYTFISNDRFVPATVTLNKIKTEDEKNERKKYRYTHNNNDNNNIYGNEYIYENVYNNNDVNNNVYGNIYENGNNDVNNNIYGNIYNDVNNNVNNNIYENGNEYIYENVYNNDVNNNIYENAYDVNGEIITAGDGTLAYSDQIFARKMKRICIGNGKLPIDTTGFCLQKNGIYVPVTTIEEYYEECNPSTTKTSEEKKGELNLIVFNMKQGVSGISIFDGTFCMKSPDIEKTKNDYSFLGPVLQSTCSFKYTITIGENIIPSEVFIIQKADYKNNNFVPSKTGIFNKIVNRPTGYILTPNLTDMTLTFKKQTGNAGYYWILIPETQGPDGTAPSQIVYIPTTEVKNFLSLLTDSNKLWIYMKNTISIRLNGNDNNNPLKLGQFIINKTKTTTNANFLSYALITLIMSIE